MLQRAGGLHFAGIAAPHHRIRHQRSPHHPSTQWSRCCPRAGDALVNPCPFLFAELVRNDVRADEQVRGFPANQFFELVMLTRSEAIKRRIIALESLPRVVNSRTIPSDCSAVNSPLPRRAWNRSSVDMLCIRGESAVCKARRSVAVWFLYRLKFFN